MIAQKRKQRTALLPQARSAGSAPIWKEEEIDQPRST
jgi:hypothetical protein